MSDTGGATGGGSGGVQTSDVPFWANFCAKFISVSYLMLCLLSCTQLLRTVCLGHKIRSFRFGFLLICFVWTLLRVIFYFADRISEWRYWVTAALFYIPNGCQVTTFSMLILFYAKMAHDTRWNLHKRALQLTAVVVNSVMFVLIGLYAGLSDVSMDNANAQKTYDTVYFLAQSLFFGALVVLAAYYLRLLALQRKSRVGPGISRAEAAVTGVIFVIFLTRCIVDLLSAFGVDPFKHQVREVVDSDGRYVKLMSTSTFVLVFLWEIIPTLIVIIFFRKMPTTNNALCVDWCNGHGCAGLAACLMWCCGGGSGAYGAALAGPTTAAGEVASEDAASINRDDYIEENMFTPISQRSQRPLSGTNPQGINSPRDIDSPGLGSDPLFADSNRYDSDGWRRSTPQRQPPPQLFAQSGASSSSFGASGYQQSLPHQAAADRTRTSSSRAAGAAVAVGIPPDLQRPLNYGNDLL